MVTYKVLLCDNTGRWDEHKFELKAGQSWQEKRHSANNSIWQAAAQRRRSHPRRTSKSLGACAVDLAGLFDTNTEACISFQKHAVLLFPRVGCSTG